MATFCLIHGAWHEPSCWDELTPLLMERGHRVLIPDLPLQDPAAGFDERIAPALEAIEGADDPLVIVGHSQGTSYSCLVAAANPEALLVHLCPRLGGFEPPPGAPDPFQEGIPWPESRPDGTTAWDEDAALEFMYWRVPQPRASMLAGRLRPMAMPRGDYPLDAPPATGPCSSTPPRTSSSGRTSSGSWRASCSASSPSRSPAATSRWRRTPRRLAELLDRVASG